MSYITGYTTVKIPKTLAEDCDRYLRKHQKFGNRSDLVRFAIRFYIEKNDGGPFTTQQNCSQCEEKKVGENVGGEDEYK